MQPFQNILKLISFKTMSVLTRYLTYSLIYLTGSITFGFINNFAGPAMHSMKKDFPELDTDEFSQKVTYFNTLPTLIASIGPFFLHFIIKKLNKRKGVIIWHFLCCINWLLLLITSSSRFVAAIVLRCIHGLFYGGFAMIIPILFCEDVPDNTVGLFGCLHSVGITLSIALIDLLGYFLNWRVVIALGAIVNLVGGFTTFLAPKNLDVPYQYVCICKKSYIPGVLKAIAVGFFQQFAGINAIQNNLQSLLNGSGLTFDPLIQAAIVSCAQAIGVFIAMFTVDALGNHFMYIVSAVGAIISTIIYSMSTIFSLPKWYPTLFIFIYMLFFGFGLSTIPWYISIYYFPQETRTFGFSILTFTILAFAYIVMTIFPYMNSAIGEFGTLLVFAGITIICTIFGGFCVTDQRNKEGDEVTLI